MPDKEIENIIPVISDELRQQASIKPVFNILFVSDNDSRLSLFRGSSIFKTFEEFYARQADISCSYIPSSKLASMKVNDFDDYNILWIDNVSSYSAAKNLSELNIELLNSIDSSWKETIDKLSSDSDATVKFIKELNAKRESKLRIIYALDELVWEGPVGRSHDVQSVQIIETLINMADSIVVPTAELRELIKYYKFVSDDNKDIFVIPTSVNADMYPLFKDFSREKGANNTFDKPRILIKGLTIPMNVQKFIAENHKKFKITVCTVGELDDHIMGLIQRQKVTHIYHWANPYVNKRNILATYALERDMAFDFVIHTKPDNLNGQMYELSTGDDDILLTIASGSLPICGVDHVGYDEDSNHLGLSSGLTFGKDSTEKSIRQMIENYSVGVRWNDAFNKCRALVESRIITSPKIISAYFSVLLGRELSHARNVLAMEAKAKIEQNVEIQ